jgi:hypothetical protein
MAQNLFASDGEENGCLKGVLTGGQAYKQVTSLKHDVTACANELDAMFAQAQALNQKVLFFHFLINLFTPPSV